MSTSAVRDVVERCQTCQSTDPASVKWRKGKLRVGNTWSRLTMSITHYGSQHFLTFIDCGPSRFAVWQPLLRQDSTSIIRQLESVFSERGSPEEILMDNDTAFRSKQFEYFLDEWEIQLRLRCAHVPSGNGIVERCHRRIERITTRKQCTVTEAACRYNITPKDNVSIASAPANAIHRYRVRIKGIDSMCSSSRREICGPYRIGDPVCVKPPDSR